LERYADLCAREQAAAAASAPPGFPSAGICSCSSRLGPLGLLTDSGRERVQPRNHRLTVKHAPGWGERGKLRVCAPKSADRHWAARFPRPLYSDRDSSGRVMQDPLNKADRYCRRAAGARCPEAPRCGTVGTPIRFYTTPSMLMASARRSSNGRNWATSGPRYSLMFGHPHTACRLGLSCQDGQCVHASHEQQQWAMLHELQCQTGTNQPRYGP
jgi:hypothetical protein